MDMKLKIIAFCCRHAIDNDIKLTGKGRLSYEPETKIVTIPCSSKADTLAIMRAFEAGADGIFILGCPEERCHMLGGNLRARKIVNYTQTLLAEIGINPERLQMIQLGKLGIDDFDGAVTYIKERITPNA